MAELPYDDHTKAYNASQVGRSNNFKLLLWDVVTINIHSPEGEGCCSLLIGEHPSVNALATAFRCLFRRTLGILNLNPNITQFTL